MKHKKAFTLIELLVVIAIIALLLSVLVPSLGKAKESARGVVCRSNLKQWGLCFSMYVQENDEKFTIGYDPAVGWISYFDWIGKMEPYFDTKDLFVCPSAKKYDVTGGTSWLGYDYKYGKTRESWWYKPSTSSTSEPDYVGSYGMNSWVNSLEAGASPQFGTKEMHWQKITNTTGASLSTVPLFADSMWLGGYALDSDKPSTLEDRPDQFGQLSRFVVNRHKDAVNVAFLDQSVGNVGLKELWGLKWNREFNTGNDQTRPGVVWPDWIKK